MQEVLALAQARKVDVILVNRMTRWGRSARFAARSLTCFKFRFVSLLALTSGTAFVTLRPWKRTLSASHSGPTPRRAKSDFLSVGTFFVPQMHSAFHDIV